jgi:hypothetical protein
MVSKEDLNRLASLSGYDRMLAMDAVARVNGVTPADVQRALDAHLGGTLPSDGASTPPPFAAVPDVPAPPSMTENLNLNEYRYGYDPTTDAKTRRSQVSQAIRCPSCGAALGIPDVRPIKVTCPACAATHTFTD